MFQMPDATAQLVIVPLFWRGVFFFGRGIRRDELGNLFGAKDFLW
jgi:hypothetical protein